MTPAIARAQRIALIALLCGAVGIAFAPIFVRLSELGPSATAFYRLFFALPAMLIWMMAEPDGGAAGQRPASAADYAKLALAGLFFAGDLSFWHWSIKLTSVANATLLANFAPIFVTLGGFLLFALRFSRTFLLGMGLAMVGAILLMSGSFALSMDHVLGDALGLVSAVFYAAYLVAVGRLRGRFSTATVMLWSGLATCVALLPVALVSGESLVATTAVGWGILVALALVSHIGGQGLIAYALAHLPAAFSSVALMLQPAIAAVLAWFLFDEALGTLQATGAAVILFGIFLARRGSRRPSG
ncbi:MAG: DMT family transporter [Rhodospirillales bacterium]|nr:DMT family transporter [Rhodospirillales bacterium]MCW8861892.1 DMT family transporter [Rhodospirillales bacterium]MCW8952485.1 DMT family transporter [Rhodospirillales bacterium]MCW8969729.1 DMT family transporter [Rhodospirillales bacterium]MCW9003366.1 DMT family transporter [Rhodospirillales bacterium]